jgi:hypothetical protein
MKRNGIPYRIDSASRYEELERCQDSGGTGVLRTYMAVDWIHLDGGFRLEACDGLIPLFWRSLQRGEERWTG